MNWARNGRSKKLLLALLTLGVLALPALADAWQELKPAGGNFRCMMPGKPEEKTAMLDTAIGKLPQHQYLYGTNTTAFLVAWVDYPADKVTKENAEKVLDGARDGAVGGGSGKLINEEKIKIDGNPGRDITFSKGNGIVVRARIYLVKNRLYQTLIAATADASKSPDVVKFLDSFKLTK